jgi:arylsulfate sulfotransferase
VLGDSLGLTATNILLNPNGTTPLSAELTFTTPVPGTVTITVQGKGQEGIPISHEFDEAASSFRLPILGLYQNYVNTVVVEFDGGAAGTTRDTLEVATAALTEPPVIEILENNLPADDASVFMFTPQNTAFDQRGEIRWVYEGEGFHLYRKLANGDWLGTLSENAIRYHFAKFAEFTMLGEKVVEYPVDNYLHHEVRKLPWGNYLVAGNSSLIDFATNGVPEEDIVIEIDADTGAIVKTWDFNLILDPMRPTIPTNDRPDDWLHNNSAIYDANDDSILITGRRQSAVAKVDYATGELKWILAPHELWPVRLQDKLLTPVDNQGNEIDPNALDFWPYGMHAVLVREPGYVAVYDNGSYRGWYADDTVPAQSYSRGVEYFVDETAMTVELVWQYDAGQTLFTPATGDIDVLDNGNFLVGFAGQSDETPRMVQIDGDEVVFQVVSDRGGFNYRAEKFGLYDGL